MPRSRTSSSITRAECGCPATASATASRSSVTYAGSWKMARSVRRMILGSGAQQQAGQRAYRQQPQRHSHLAAEAGAVEQRQAGDALRRVGGQPHRHRPAEGVADQVRRAGHPG
ncbi:hypothetical protein O7611_14375 [Micromonospora sp. WMMC273]|nr:hypothetical protein [Micromonospora sp. WMMC273]MCZ7475585.1 hypothetical protein [Micromonospora sp. WMMC273]